MNKTCIAPYPAGLLNIEKWYTIVVRFIQILANIKAYNSTASIKSASLIYEHIMTFHTCQYLSKASCLRALKNFLFDGDSFSLLSESSGSFRLLPDWGDPVFSQEMTNMAVI